MSYLHGENGLTLLDGRSDALIGLQHQDFQDPFEKVRRGRKADGTCSDDHDG